MKISLTIFAIILLFLIFGERDVICKSRGGGSRGGGSRGGSRSGGSRSGYRSGSSSYRSGGIKSRSVGTSSRYSRWSIRVGVSSSTRYRYSPWTSQQRAILYGHIIMSSHYRSRFHVYDQSYYSSISVCYNEEPLYGRNISASPWFVCPWDDLSERYCCGDEVEERCCRYFDRPGPKAGLIIGLILILLLCIIIYYYYKKSRKTKQSTTIVYTAECKDDTEMVEGATLLVYPPVVNDMQYTPDPAFNYNPTPPYPVMSNPNPPYPDMTNPNPPYPGAMDPNPPYPAYPSPGDPNIGYPQAGGTNVQYSAMTDGSNLPYAINPTGNQPYSTTGTQDVATAPPFGNAPSQPPPTYEDALKIKS